MSGRPSDEAFESEAARDFEGRTLRFNDTRHSMWMRFAKEDYAAAKSVLVGRVDAEKRRQEDARFGEASDSLGYVSYDKRLYDACIDLLCTGNGSGSAVRPRVVVHAPLELLIGCSNEGVAEIAGVGPVPVEVVRRLACDAKVDLAVEDATGSILNRVGPGGMRRRCNGSRSTGATKDVVSPAAPTPSSPTCTTLSTGPTVVRRTWRTWSPCAAGTTGPCTSWAGPSGAMRTPC